MLALVLTDLVDRHDAGMIEVGRGLGFEMKPPHVGLAGKLAGQNHLEGDRPVEAHLPRLVNDPHAAAGDLLEQFIVAEVPDGADTGRPGSGAGTTPRSRWSRPGGRGVGFRHERGGVMGRLVIS